MAGNQRPWPADKVERWSIDRLIPYAKNARTHTDAQIWLNSTRQNFVDDNPDDHQPDQVTGCGTLFLWFLDKQLGFFPEQIIAAGGGTLGEVYHNLTGRSDAWSRFAALVNSHYPQPDPATGPYNLNSDNLFPVAELSAFWSPNIITCGYSGTTQVVLDKFAPGPVRIALRSDDPSVVQADPTVTVPEGALSTSVTVRSTAIAGPFPPKNVGIHATYAGTDLRAEAEVSPPAVQALTFVPDTVTCGDSVTGTVTLNRASLLGDVHVQLFAAGGSFFTIPPEVIIPQEHESWTFEFPTNDSPLAFRTRHYGIDAVYGSTMASGGLTIKSRVVAGILDTLTVTPNVLEAGHTARGTVMLVEPVPVETNVGIAVLDSGMVGTLPLPGTESSFATVERDSVPVPVGHTTASFDIVASSSVLRGTRHKVIVEAAAVDTRMAPLTITG